ncbi:glycoside hydrolase family 18 protein [Wolfiporia cocos MD-104 SS10]|uniref:Glycoside hydrolase family 18 protein n=1 Tax=Wolfiporia cocos (strain MD-104) TaxID=742152 RepID=A0A2H3JFZ5_WOLCO|nr:glycoside hydrolase family 18 protein [Wolfiporia cocos MD-104 SS10]
MAYYPDWAAPAYPPEKIDFARFDWIDYAFAVPDAQYNLTWDGSADGGGLLARLVDAAHRAGTKVKLSVGGWTGSQYFSPAVADDASRQTFVQNILAVYEQYGLDGIDIDWEYPGQAGDAGNAVDPRDTANFLAFLQQLRAALPQGAALSAAAQTVAFADADGAPAHDVSAFAAVLDWVLIMNYDAFGSSASPGPNAPLDDACGNSTQPAQNAAAALAAWTAAGVPAAQLVLGVPSYGYVSRSDATRLRTRAPPAGAQIYATSEDGSTDAGQMQFRGLVAQGILQYAPLGENGTDGAGSAGAGNGTDSGAPPTRVEIPGGELQSLYAGWSGFERCWDACSSTPFLRSEGAEQVVTYDDPLSLGLKAAFAREQGMRGVNLFDVSGDTDQWDLTDGCRTGLGLPV